MIINQLQEKIKDALKSGDSTRASTYRMLLAALKNEQIAKQHELSTDEEMAIIKRQLKQREEAVAAYENAGREEQAAQEKKEAELLKEFLPEQMGQEQVAQIVDEVISSMGEVSPQEFGKVMQAVMAKTKGQADGKIVAEEVKRKLNG